MVSYLEFCLNLLGDDETDMYDKDVIVHDSYQKIFRDAQVQIEDDLDPSRKQPINKSVQAYLKDVDFFFKTVKFKLEVQDVSWFMNSQNQIYYKVTLLRKINGTDIEGRTIQNSQQRFIEINLDEQKQDLKIASYYTTKITETQDLFTWWETLPLEWKKFFGKRIPFTDNLTMGDVASTMPDLKMTDSVKISSKYYPLNNQNTINGLKKLLSSETLDLSGQKFFTDLSPISKFSGLKELNLSNTLTKSIDGIRACSKLEKLNLSSTAVKHIESFKYLSSLRELDCSHTMIDSIENMVYLQNLVQLDLSGSFVKDIRPLEQLSSLKSLSLKNTRITNIDALAKLQLLEVLDLEKTDIESVEALKNNQQLKKLDIDNTTVSSIDALSGLQNLTLVYADGTKLTKENLKNFTSLHPSCQVIFESGELLQWWDGLSIEWKSVFSQYTGGSSKLNKEQLHELIGIKVLNISTQPVKDFSGLKYLSHLKKLEARELHINNLKGLEKLSDLEFLNLSGSVINDFSNIRNLRGLKTLNLSNTGFNTIHLVDSLKQLAQLDIEHTQVPLADAETFDASHPGIIVFYRSEILRTWWNALSQTWKDYFIQNILYLDPDDGALHGLVKKEKIVIEDNMKISDLAPLKMFVNLKELTVSGTAVSDFSITTSFRKLEVLNIPRNPVTGFEFLSQLTQLKELNVSSLRIYNIDFLYSLHDIEYLNLSNISIKSVKPVSSLVYLKYLDISNTKVSSLAPLKKLILLDNLICYNTSVKENAVKKFKKWRPGCNVIFY